MPPFSQPSVHTPAPTPQAPDRQACPAVIHTPAPPSPPPPRLLIAKRALPPRILGIPVLEILFYATWVGLRNLWYPYLVYALYVEWREEAARNGTSWNIILIAPIFQLFLTGLNYYWTLSLLLKKPKAKKVHAHQL